MTPCFQSFLGEPLWTDRGRDFKLQSVIQAVILFGHDLYMGHPNIRWVSPDFSRGFWGSTLPLDHGQTQMLRNAAIPRSHVTCSPYPFPPVMLRWGIVPCCAASRNNSAMKRSRKTDRLWPGNLASQTRTLVIYIVRVIQYQYPILSPCYHRQHRMKSAYIYEIRWDGGIAGSEWLETKQVNQGRMGTMPSHEIGFSYEIINLYNPSNHVFH